MTTIEPKEITRDTETGIEIASFGYYAGIDYCKNNGILQSGNYKAYIEGNGFLVCCGDVMIKVKANDFPDVVRREI